MASSTHVSLHLSLASKKNLYLHFRTVFEAVPIVFVEKRHFGLDADGLMFLGVGIGTCVGSLINFIFARRYASLTVRWRGFPPPEERLYGAMIAGPSLVVGALWFGWAGQYASVHWVVPALGLILIGLSISLIFSSLLGYLVDTYLQVPIACILIFLLNSSNFVGRTVHRRSRRT